MAGAPARSAPRRTATADKGYQATQRYSLAAPADTDRVELEVQARLGGEVSPYLADDLPVGAEVEIKGSLGGWFVWTPETPARSC
ncbi:FAD-binding oxidoreductase [Streptomyces parvulus]|uniref:FAD-binding oxidoreductase n=1 Tax=Streptomyces parvulus TaxID=146923 RepID=UPI0037D2612E